MRANVGVMVLVMLKDFIDSGFSRLLLLLRLGRWPQGLRDCRTGGWPALPDIPGSLVPIGPPQRKPLPLPPAAQPPASTCREWTGIPPAPRAVSVTSKKGQPPFGRTCLCCKAANSKKLRRRQFKNSWHLPCHWLPFTLMWRPTRPSSCLSQSNASCGQQEDSNTRSG